MAANPYREDGVDHTPMFGKSGMRLQGEALKTIKNWVSALLCSAWLKKKRKLSDDPSLV
jgi:hypothetical protein